MGDIADYQNDEAMEEWFANRWSGEGYYGRRTPRTKWKNTCNKCGTTGLKWRANADGWALYENEKVEHNRLKRHVCPIPDDFENLEDTDA